MLLCFNFIFDSAVIVPGILYLKTVIKKGLVLIKPQLYSMSAVYSHEVQRRDIFIFPAVFRICNQASCQWQFPHCNTNVMLYSTE